MIKFCMVSLELLPITLLLKVPWKLSRNTSIEKTNYIITLDKDYQSEVAPNIRYGETPQRIEMEFKQFQEILQNKTFEDALQFKAWSHSLKFGLEAVYIKKICAEKKQSLWQYLALKKPEMVATSFSLPIMPVEQIESYLKPIHRFKTLKIKLNQESAIETIKEVMKHTNVPLRLDGNEAWPDLDSYQKFAEQLPKINIEFIEQPMPASRWDDYRALKKISPYLLMADESLETQDDFDLLSQGFHAVNIKLMKSGSLILAKQQLEHAKKCGLKTMIGCMIETSLGISYAMELSSLADFIDLDGFLLIQNDPYQLVTEKDGLLSLV